MTHCEHARDFLSETVPLDERKRSPQAQVEEEIGGGMDVITICP